MYSISPLQVLELLHLLVKYGYYSNQLDINELIPLLISLLDGKYDKPFPDANPDQAELFLMVTFLLFVCH